MLQIMAISLMSGMSTPLGGAIVLLFPRLSQRWLTLILGMAAGIMVTVVITELMPASIRSAGHWVFLWGALGGWVFMEIARRLLNWLTQKAGGGGFDGDGTSSNSHAGSSSMPLDSGESGILEGPMGGTFDGPMGTSSNSGSVDGSADDPIDISIRNIGWFVTLAIALHDLPEGIAIGAGDAVHRQIGIIIALAIAIHNIPEGMGIAAPLRLGGVSKGRILAVTLLTGLVTPLGTLISLGFVRLSPVAVSLSLAFACGAMVYVVAQSILPSALTRNWILTALGGVVGTGIMLAVSSLSV